MILTLDTHIPFKVVCIYQLSDIRPQLFLKNPLSSLFSIEEPKLQRLTVP